jgi:cellulose synthase/poly-beta-1,6-N-acetylglucosamine synthase-like glycosyltransferase
MMSRRSQDLAHSDTDGRAARRQRDGRIHAVPDSFIDLTALEQDSERDAVAFDAKLEVLARATRDQSLLSRSQKIAALVAIAGGIIALAVAPVFTVVAVNAALVVFFCAATVMKLVLTDRGIKENCSVVVTSAELAAIADEDLPMYTILLPVYHEAGMLGQLVDGIAALDYPSDRLDVKLLVEEDDLETREAATAMHLPPYVELVVVPDVGPRGKPRACNQGLVRAKGEFLVIYDAEDRPERDQLRKAVCAFKRAAPDVVCLQAKLNYFNRTHNLLTRWFTAEYSIWFDQLLPGLQSANVAIPLGGTSNHFITARLLELRGWDPFNVTEDADLGVRIYLQGWKTAILDATTYEEATSRYRNWIRQRSRWVKGYTQTFLTHTSQPIQQARRMGLKAFVVFVLFFGAGTLCLLLNPFYWLLAAWWFASHQHWIETMFPRPVLYLGTVALFVGNIACLMMIVVGTFSRRNYEDVKWAFLSPLYWLLMSAAAWKAVTQLFYKPSYWEKTEHGFCRYEPDDFAPVPSRAEEPELVS